MKEGGFDGFEPFTTRNLPVNDENMAEAFELAPKYNLRMATIYWADEFHVPEQHPRILKECHRFLGYLKKFNCDRLTIGPPTPHVDDEKVAIANLAKIMNAVGKIALDEYKIKTGIHPHVGGLIENPRQIDSLMAQTDPRYFNLSPDTAQIWMGGGEVVSMMEKYKSRIVYIHYKDIVRYNRSLRGYGDNVIELGRGVLDFPRHAPDPEGDQIQGLDHHRPGTTPASRRSKAPRCRWNTSSACSSRFTRKPAPWRSRLGKNRSRIGTKVAGRQWPPDPVSAFRRPHNTRRGCILKKARAGRLCGYLEPLLRERPIPESF